MSNPTSRISSARRNAEALLGKAQKRNDDLKLEQEREKWRVINEVSGTDQAAGAA